MTANGTTHRAHEPPPPQLLIRLRLLWLVGPRGQSRRSLAHARRCLLGSAILLGLTLGAGLIGAELGSTSVYVVAVEAGACGFILGCWHALGSTIRLLRTLEAILDLEGE